jgi:autotransporter-associated beta strand protein
MKSLVRDFQYYLFTGLVVLGLTSFEAFAAGPTLSDSNLFASMNLNYPGLEQVKTNVTAGDYPAAKTNLAYYLRWRTNVNWHFDPHAITNIAYNATDAYRASTGYVSPIGISFVFTNGDIDWFYNTTKDPTNTYADNNEWQWQLNRMEFWPNMGNAYWATTNEYFAQKWVAQFRDWTTSCPVPTTSQNGSGSAWRTIESGIRMGGNWPNTYHRFLLSPSFLDQDVVDYMKSCVEHARYLRKFPTSANWLTMEMSGLYTVGALYPEMTEATDWRTFASDKLYGEQTNQFYPDGVQKELSPGYHGVALGNILAIYNMAKLQNRTAELPANYLANLEKGYEHYVWLMTPDRKLPQFNDSISAPDAKSSLTTGYSLFTNRQDFLWVISNGASGAPPSVVSCTYPYAGYSVMRSGWSTADNYLCLDGGPLGAAHIHQDKLNVVVWAYGRKILYDSGGGAYETSIWRSYGTTTFSHNTVIVDGAGQAGGDGSAAYSDPDYVSQSAVANRWENNAAHSFAYGLYDRGYSSFNTRPANHHRRVLFIKPDIYLVADTLVTNNAASHTYEARWHLLPTNTVMDAVTKAVTSSEAAQPNLAVVPCLLSNLTVTTTVGYSNAYYTNLLGWNVKGGTPNYAPASTVVHKQTGTGTRHFLTLLLPLKQGDTNPVTLVTSTGPTSARVDLADGRRFLVAADPDPKHGLQFTEVLADNSTNRLVGAGFTPPSISSVADQITAPNTPVGPLSFTVGETNLSPTNLVVIAHSFSPRLVDDAGIIVEGAGSNRTVTVTPSFGRAGTASIRLTVVDTNGATAATDFNLTVLAPILNTYYWDTSTNAGLQSGSGIWSSTNGGWSATNTGSNPLLPWPVVGNDAYIRGANDMAIISVSETQNVGSLVFTNGTFIVTNGTLNHYAGAFILTTEGNTTIHAALTGDTDLVKGGASNLTLTGTASYFGDTIIKRGAIQTLADNRLPTTAGLVLGAGGTAGKLDLSAANQAVADLYIVSTNGSATNMIVLGAGKTLAVNGPVLLGGDSNGVTARLVVTGALGTFSVTRNNGTFQIGGGVTSTSGNSASVDLIGLGRFDLNLGKGGILRVNDNSSNTGSGSTALYLASSNYLTLGTLAVGDGGRAGTQILQLGSGENVINASTINVGTGGRDAGSFTFRTSTGTLVVRGVDGGTNRADLNIATGGGGTAGSGSPVFNVTGHSADLLLDTLFMCDQLRSGSLTPTFSFNQGIMDVRTIIMAQRIGANTNCTATINLGGGIVNIGAGGVMLASNAIGNLNITGGVVTVSGDILKTPGGTGTATLTLNATNATLDMTGHEIGTASDMIDRVSLQAGTLRNLGELNGGNTSLIKTNTARLTLAGTNGYTGGTVVSAGTLNLAGSLNSVLTMSGGVLTGGGTVAGSFALNTPAKYQARIAGITPGVDYDQLIITGTNSTVTLAGALNLNISNGLPSGAVITLIRNDGLAPISGTFSNLPQAATFSTNGATWSISYAAGDGNEVALTLISGGVNAPPVVNLLTPTNNATVSSPLTLVADATDPNGNLALVEFFGDHQKLGELSTPPFNFAWTNLTSGYHSAYVRAVDAEGASAQTPVVLVSVSWPSLTLVTNGSDWKYHDLGMNLGTNWQRPEYDDSTWASGPAPLGYGDANGWWPRTTNSFGGNTNNKYITTYYRKAFVVPDAPAWSNAWLSIQRDDGTVIYLNGTEVFRSNMPTGAVNYLTLASSAVSIANETNWFSTNLAGGLLMTGTNVFAVELHQNTNNSTDIWFDLMLGSQPTNAAPRLNLSAPNQTLAFRWPGWAGGLTLWSSTNLFPTPTWTLMTNAGQFTNGEWQLNLPPTTNGTRYFRLQ